VAGGLGGRVGNMHAELVDRGDELAAFQMRLAAGGAGPQALAVSGEPGIGKTRLLAEFARCATARGVRVITSQAAAHEQDVPFAAVAEMIIGLLRPAPDQPALPAAIGQELAALPAQSPSSHRRGHEHYAALRTALDLTSGRQGLVVLLDDLHWADQGTVELLGYLLRQPCSARVTLVLAYRPRQVSGRLAAAIATATDAGRARQVEVGPLSVDGVRAVVGPGTPAQQVRRLHTESGGNPLYLMTLVKEGAPARARELPSDVDAVLRAELEALSPGASTAVRAAAVLGTAFDIEALAPVAQLPAVTVSVALDELTRADLVRPDPVPGRLRFRHPLLRRTAYQQARVAWRRSAHARAAALQSSQKAPVQQWAHHVEQSATVGDEQAVALLVRAAEAVRFRTPRTAAGWFGSAARLLPDSDNAAPRRAALLLSQAETLTMAGQLRQSRITVGEVRAMLTPDSDGYVRAMLHAALVEHLLGQQREAAALLRRGLGELASAGPQTAALWLELARIELAGGRPGAAQDALRRGLAAAGDHDAGVLQDALTGGLRAVGAYLSGDLDGAVAVADQVGTLVDGMPDPELCRNLRAVVWLGWADLLRGHYREVARRQSRAVELAHTSGQMHVLPLLLTVRGAALRWLGRLDEAGGCFAEAAEIARSTGASTQLTVALAGSCQVALLAGDQARAPSLAGELRNGAASTGGWFAAWAGAALAADAVQHSPAEQSAALIIEACGGPELPHFDPGVRSELYELLARTALRAGDQTAVSAWACRAQAAAAAAALPVAAGFAALAQSHAHTAAGDAAGAARHARDAVTAFERAGTPIETARAGLLAARALAAAGRPGDALAYLDRAREHSAATGARALHNEIVRDLRRLGLRRTPHLPHYSTTGAKLDTLSPREREIALLVARGCTNRAIASTLFLSVKTVERHLARIFTKLDISSRAALAALTATHATTTTPAA